MRNNCLLNIILLLLTLFQSVAALADVHETFERSAANHLSEHQPAHHSDMMQTLTDDIQGYNEQALEQTKNQHDCSHCCHCHAHTPLSLPVNDALAASTQAGSMNNDYTRILIVRALSPHLRPPIYF